MDNTNPWLEFYEEEIPAGAFVCSIMEKLSVIPEAILGENLYYILYVVLHNIYIGQSLSKFVHGDLHLGNILCKQYNQKTIDLVYHDEIIRINNKYGWN